VQISKIGKCFDYVPQIFQITCEILPSPSTFPPSIRTMPGRDTGRIFHWGSQSGDSQSYGYGGGGGACPQMNAGFHGQSIMGTAGDIDEETCAPFPPTFGSVVQQRRDTQGGPVTSTTLGQGRSPTPNSSNSSPILGYGTGVRTSSLFCMSGTPTSAAVYSSAGSTLPAPSDAPSEVSRSVAASAPQMFPERRQGQTLPCA
jgi:hypothetical protein